MEVVSILLSGVAMQGLKSRVRVPVPGGRVAHPEGQNEEENQWNFRENKKNLSKFEEKMRKVELLPTRDFWAGYGPDSETSRGVPF